MTDQPADMATAGAMTDLVSSRWLSDRIAERIDRAAGAAVARASAGLPLPRILLAYADWAMHLGLSPGKVGQLVEAWARQYRRMGRFTLNTMIRGPSAPREVEPEAGDRRFADEGWRNPPFALLEQAFLLRQEWWREATTGVRGVSDQDAALVRFFTDRLLDSIAPGNFPLTNPQVLRTTWQEKGANLLRGARNLVRDVYRDKTGQPPAALADFRVGENLATTPGRVVYRNRLIELIQYEPTTKRVHPEPVLIVPAWIMKFYILDLAEGQSMVRYLLDQGHTVFIVSWKNPDAGDRDLGMDDYRSLGPMAALDAIGDLLPARSVHAMGYCVGGTLMSITAATMARDGDDRLASLTLLAAQSDFTLAGELKLFINEAQLTWLDHLMNRKGVLEKDQMAGAFKLLRASDMVWQPFVDNYLLGADGRGIPLMAWNADATRMPYRMHTEYLRRLYLHNELAQGRYLVDGRPIAIRDIRVPIFAVGTETDHIAPWHSAYKICLLSQTDDLTFLLTSGGHNAGIITPPGHPRRRYRQYRWGPDDRYLSPDEFCERAEPEQGSWWPAWQAWLAGHSGNKVAPPALGDSLADAPGTYVHQR
ncbi:alpha/beta fold hydrolase [Salinisphaera sp. P385]|uniref:Alpha/beta fold hydrolase n=1 Tax=Spectribacter acetivorans TaxID=3075603 RepID=A0ABU3B6R2_9GAMM|nr:alpha/beta fold hydrolase [Salinisphaera sp. P385]MDT0618129.1 alpha/beta fold hydrolase [Salinisphaera sp. P385]